MANYAFVYRCPATGHRVQGFVGASVPDDTSTYEGVMCAVCNRVHLVKSEQRSRRWCRDECFHAQAVMPLGLW
jgi:hypothetical protein